MFVKQSWRVLCGSLLSALSVACGAEEPIQRIAFGSCAKQDRPQPIWEAIVAAEPELFLFTGDNIYADTEDIAEMQAKYEQLAAVPGFAKLRSTCPILATWDDHDYGRNDAGGEFTAKVESQRLFMDFFGEPPDSPRRRSPGVYDARVFGPDGRRVQVILLDTRYFRSPLKTGERAPAGSGRPGRYVANNDPDATILGAEQWKWLEKQLRVPAELRIIVSSIQAVAEEHRFEKWMNIPHERARLFQLIRDTRAEGVLLVSGDRHIAELSRMDAGIGYTLLDLTSSGLNQTSGFYNEINRHRHGAVYRAPNFGLITIDWDQPDPQITLEIRAEDGEIAIWYALKLSALRRGR